MKKINLESPLLLSITSIILCTIVFYFLSGRVAHESYLYGFLYNFLPVQFFNTWLFTIALLFVVARTRNHLKESALADQIGISEYEITRRDAEQMLTKIPADYQDTICYRRFREILSGFLSSGDIIRLNEELSRRDLSEVERGHLILNSMRQIIPVVGFFGTVIGLSKGMAKFPEISSKVGNIADLKDILRGFSADLSVAFDTTLLALGYTIVVIVIASFLKGKEESHVGKIDETSRVLIAKLKITPGSAQGEYAVGDMEKLINSNNEHLFKSINAHNEAWSQKFFLRMDELIKSIKASG